ncbi:MAG: CvpA family protein [Eubacterium sp.]|nr:CvpA family protein [Eubacterium sp.]
MDMTNLILSIVILGFGIIGYVKGAVNTLIGFLGMIASFIIAGIFSPMIASGIIDSPVVQSYLSGSVAPGLLEKFSQYSADALSQFGAQAGLDNLQGVADAVLQGGTEAQSAIAAALTPVAYQLVYGAVFLILLILSGIVIAVVKRAGAGVNQVPVIGFANRLLGGLMGLVMGLVIGIVVTAAVLYFGILSGDVDLVQSVQAGPVTGELVQLLKLGGAP